MIYLNVNGSTIFTLLKNVTPPKAKAGEYFLANAIHQGIAQMIQKVQNQRVIFIISMIFIADTLTCMQHLWLIRMMLII